MKKFITTVFVLLNVLSLMAESTLPEGMLKLTPDDVELVVDGVLRLEKRKNMVVAGSPQKGYLTYFAATEALHGEELWVSDGTIEGTKMVKDIAEGTSGSDVAWMRRFNDKVVFQATSSDEIGAELWISDGTSEGTYMVKDIHDFGSSNPAGFSQVNETQFVFVAQDFDSETYNADATQRWLWVSDGTEEGTKLIMECDTRFPGKNSNTNDNHYCRVGRQVYFKADSKDKEYGEELWITDGTTEGTHLVKDINTEVLSEGSTADNALGALINFYNEKLVLQAFSIECANEPWASDGTEEGTYMIKDLNPNYNDVNFPQSGSFFRPTVYDGRVYSRGFDESTNGMELMATNLDSGNYELVYDFNQNPTDGGTASAFADPWCVFDGVLFLGAQTGTDPDVVSPKNYGINPFYTDGTAEGTVMHTDLNPGIGNAGCWNGTVVSGSLYFQAQNENPTDGVLRELFKLDSKEDSIIKVMDLVEGKDLIHTLRDMNGDLMFTSGIVQSLFTYKYRKPNYDPAVDSVSMEINYATRDGETAISDISKSSTSIQLYPNPANETLFVKSSANITSLRISNLSGQTLIKHLANDIKNVNISTLEDGIYLVSTLDINGQKAVSRFIKK